MDDTNDEFLSAGEFHDALQNLTRADLLRLQRQASYLAGDVARGEDLLGQAVMRALGGSRRCPRELKPTAFLYSVMRSMIYWARRKQAKLPVIEALDATGTEGAARSAAAERNPEEVMSAREDAEARADLLDTLFADDEDASNLIVGLLTGLTPEEIRDQLGFDETKYATVRRRIRRRIDKATKEEKGS